MSVSRLSDSQLHEKLKTLVGREREIVTQVLRHLREVEYRRLFSAHKCSSLHDYCVRVLGYSDSEAGRRISAMRLMREIPQVEKKIETGALSLSNVAKAQSFFRNEAKVRSQQFGGSEKQLVPRSEKVAVLGQLENTSSRKGERILLSMSSQPESFVERQRPISECLTEIRFAADEELMGKIEKIKGLLAHKKTNLKIAELVDELCEIAIEKLDPGKRQPRRKTSMKKALNETPVKNSTHLLRRRYKASNLKTSHRKTLSARVKRIVWKKSKSRCENCHTERNLQIDHIEPIAKGGTDDVKNLRLLCRSCNQRSAIENLGMAKMQSWLLRPQSGRDRPR